MHGTPMPAHSTTRHRRALEELRHRLPVAAAASQPTPSAMSTGRRQVEAAKRAVEGAYAAGGGGGSQSTLSTPVRSPSLFVFDDEADEEDQENRAATRVASASATTTPDRFEQLQRGLPEFVPVPLKLTHEPPKRPSMRPQRDAGPSSGKLAPPSATAASGPTRTSLFPVSSEATAGGSGASTTTATTGAHLLQASLGQILATKETARRYVESMRHKVLQYMHQNRQLAQTNAREAMQQQGILHLKKTLSARIAQLELTQKLVGRREDEAKTRIEKLQDDFKEAKAQHAELLQTHRDAVRAAQDESKSFERLLGETRSDAAAQLEDVRATARAQEARLTNQLGQEKEEKEKLQQQVEQLEEQLGQVKVQLRMAQLKPPPQAPTTMPTAKQSTESTASSEHTQRLEVALESACDEVERLQSELHSSKAALASAVEDIQQLVEVHGRAQRMAQKLRGENTKQAKDLEALTHAERQARLDFEEASDVRDAFQSAYEATLREKADLSLGMTVLEEEFGAMRHHLCEMVLEQSSILPLPVDALEMHPEMSLLLAGGGASLDDDQEADDQHENADESLVSIDLGPLDISRSAPSSIASSVRTNRTGGSSGVSHSVGLFTRRSDTANLSQSSSVASKSIASTEKAPTTTTTPASFASHRSGSSSPGDSDLVDFTHEVARRLSLTSARSTPVSDQWWRGSSLSTHSSSSTPISAKSLFGGAKELHSQFTTPRDRRATSTASPSPPSNATTRLGMRALDSPPRVRRFDLSSEAGGGDSHSSSAMSPPVNASVFTRTPPNTELQASSSRR